MVKFVIRLIDYTIIRLLDYTIIRLVDYIIMRIVDFTIIKWLGKSVVSITRSEIWISSISVSEEFELFVTNWLGFKKYGPFDTLSAWRG